MAAPIAQFDRLIRYLNFSGNETFTDMPQLPLTKRLGTSGEIIVSGDLIDVNRSKSMNKTQAQANILQTSK